MANSGVYLLMLRSNRCFLFSLFVVLAVAVSAQASTGITPMCSSVSLTAVEAAVEATCTGAANCRACKNCKYCGHCAERGGSCGVCSTADPPLRVYQPSAGSASNGQLADQPDSRYYGAILVVDGTTSLNLRQGAGSGSAVIRALPQGARMIFLARHGDWVKVRLGDGVVGYVAAGYVAVVE